MDLSAFRHNYATAKSLCRRPLDRFKYLFWLYSRSLPNIFRSTLTLRMAFGPPVGTASLTVRCNGGSDAFIFSEVYERRYYDLDLPTAPRTILDAGANAGFTALFFARKYPEAALACVEPMPDNVRLLRVNVAQNGLSVRVFPDALCVDDGPVAMQMAGNDYGHKIADIGFGRALAGGTIEVAGISVPTLMAQLGWERIGLLKIDIEGYEGVLLREKCEWLERVDTLCIECHEGFGEADLQELARKFGFGEPVNLPGIWLLARESR